MEKFSEEHVLGACPEFEARLEDYVSSELDGRDLIQVKHHLEGCPRCHAALDLAREGSSLLGDYAFEARSALSVSPDFAPRAMAKIRTAQNDQAAEREGFWESFVYFGWRFAATAAVAVILVAGFGASRMRNPQANVAGVRPVAMGDMLAVHDVVPPTNRDETLVMMAGMGNER